MVWDRDSIPDHVKDKVDDAAVRRELGLTFAQKASKKDRQNESKLRTDVIAFCRRHDVLVISPNPTKRSTIQKGAADLTLGKGDRLLLMELKVGANQPSPEQKDFANLAAKTECTYYVVRTYETAIQLIINHFHLTISPPE